MRLPPRVTVVIPAYDAEASVGAAVSSVLQQTVAAVDVVVVDDGSRDRTAAVAAAFGDRVRVVSQPNQGVAGARNAGIAAARTELIAFVDADDYLFDRHVEALLDLYDRAPGIVTANAFWLFPGGIDPRRTRHSGRFPPAQEQRQAILETNFVSTMSLFSKDLWERLGGFDVTLRHAEDWDFWLRAIHVGGVTVTHQPQPLALYRHSIAGLTADREAMDQATRRVLQKAAEELPLSPAERRYVVARLDSPSPIELTLRADEQLRAGAYRQAARSYRAAARLAPRERALVTKARLLRVAPAAVGPLLRRRAGRRDRRVALPRDDG
jgi:GT2 family glycosyltransferase